MNPTAKDGKNNKKTLCGADMKYLYVLLKKIYLRRAFCLSPCRCSRPARRLTMGWTFLPAPPNLSPPAKPFAVRVAVCAVMLNRVRRGLSRHTAGGNSRAACVAAGRRCRIFRVRTRRTKHTCSRGGTARRRPYARRAVFLPRQRTFPTISARADAYFLKRPASHSGNNAILI